jgi:large subunit ribosomal protein L15
MTTTHRSKISRHRGSHTHSCGSKKKGRGAGNRGGHGMSGTGKRADSKKPSIWKDTKYFGRHGFSRAGYSTKTTATNIQFFDRNVEQFMADKSIALQDGLYHVNLKAFGFDKLLSGGKVGHKFLFVARLASPEAVRKVKEAGGEVKLDDSAVRQTAEAEAETKQTAKPKKEK